MQCVSDGSAMVVWPSAEQDQVEMWREGSELDERQRATEAGRRCRDRRVGAERRGGRACLKEQQKQ